MGFALAPQLLLMRHAKADRAVDALADFDRPLKKRGRRDASRMAEFLLSQQLVPERVISSPALRARQTALVIVEELRLPEPEWEPRLYEANLETWRQVLAELPRGPRILIVAHNPGLEETLEVVTGSRIRMPTAAVAAFCWRSDALFLTLASLELVDIWHPRQL
jgi:phosphohistidine phosphatase